MLFHFLGALMLSRIGYLSSIGHVAKYQALNDDGAQLSPLILKDLRERFSARTLA